jgi:hypothetical protein
VGNGKVLPPTQQCAASYNIIRQIILVTTSNHSVSSCAIFPRFILRFFFLFPRLKRALKGHRHADIQTIQTAMTIQLCSIRESNFQDCFKDFQKRWKRWIDAGWSYF